jgi:hypothetical protein
VSIVQQRICLLSGEIELNVARRTPLRQQAAELGSSAGDRHAYRRGNTTGKHPGADGVIRHFLRVRWCDRVAMPSMVMKSMAGSMPRGQANEQSISAKNVRPVRAELLPSRLTVLGRSSRRSRTLPTGRTFAPAAVRAIAARRHRPMQQPRVRRRFRFRLAAGRSRGLSSQWIDADASPCVGAPRESGGACLHGAGLVADLEKGP